MLLLDTKIIDETAPKPFNPFKIEINVKNLEDAKILYRFFNHAALIDANPDIRPLATIITDAVHSHTSGINNIGSDARSQLDADFAAFNRKLIAVIKEYMPHPLYPETQVDNSIPLIPRNTSR